MNKQNSLLGKTKSSREALSPLQPDLQDLRRALGEANSGSHLYPTLAPQSFDPLKHPSLVQPDTTFNPASISRAHSNKTEVMPSLLLMAKKELRAPGTPV
jgi:hypothetical protein